MLKSLLANPAVQFVLGRAIGLYMHLVAATTRWRRVNRAAAEPFWSGDGKVLICTWHGRFMLFHRLWAFGRGVPKAMMLISRSREGGIVTHAAQTVGAGVIRGSSAKGKQDKGGVGAGLGLVDHMEAGGAVAMTPDGPRGPRMRAQLGTVKIARLAQAAMLPMAWSTRWRIQFQSWDRFVFPLPFGRGALVWGDPIPPPPADADGPTMEACRLKLEQELIRVTAEADRLAGVAPVEPAPPRGTASARRDELQAAK